MANINVSSTALREYANKIGTISENIDNASELIARGANKVVDVWRDSNGATFSNILESDIKPKITKLRENVSDMIAELEVLAKSYDEQADIDKAKVQNIEI